MITIAVDVVALRYSLTTSAVSEWLLLPETVEWWCRSDRTVRISLHVKAAVWVGRRVVEPLDRSIPSCHLRR